MSIVNRRNALIGWATWKVGKRVARKKARHAVPAVEEGRPNKPALVAGTAAALGGTLVFLKARKRASGAKAEAEAGTD